MTPPEINHSPPWNRNVKTVVGIGVVVFIIAVLWRFQTLINPLIIAVVLAYLLNPIIILIDSRTPRLSRNAVTTIVYITFAIILIGIFIAIGYALYNQVTDLVAAAPAIIENLPERIESLRAYFAQPISIGSREYALPIPEGSLNWENVSDEVLGYVNPAFAAVGASLGGFAVAALSTLGWLVFILFASIYISNDIPRIGSTIGRAANAPGYQADAERLWREFGRIWNSYLRGQVILGIVIFVVVSATLGLLGVDNALALGLLSGLLEFIPMVGPFIGTGAAVLVALFQPENYLGFSTVSFVLIVLAAMMIIQQIENSILVPRIVGDALDLHPILVLMGAIMGGSLAGILGAILAAPVIATIKLIGTYIWRKMFDLPPFPEPEVDLTDEPSWLESLWERWQMRRAEATLKNKR